MKCKQASKYLRLEINESDFSEHLKSCAECGPVFSLINETMNLLDEEIEIPIGLTEKVLKQKNKLGSVTAHFRIDLSKYLQLAAVVAVGIFLGVALGTRANPEIFLSKKMKKDKALIDYRESHHFADQSSIFSF